MICPGCNNEVMDVVECDTDNPFTAYNPMDGLTAWGAYSVQKELLHIERQTAHIKFADGHERLVIMLRALIVEFSGTPAVLSPEASDEFEQGYVVCDCGKYVHVFRAATLSRLPKDYSGELCGECSCWMVAVEKLSPNAGVTGVDRRPR